MLNKIRCWWSGHPIHPRFNSMYELIPNGWYYEQCPRCGELVRVVHQRSEECPAIIEYHFESVE